MLLGMSEGLREYGNAFFAVSRKHKIYSKLSGGPGWKLHLHASTGNRR